MNTPGARQSYYESIADPGEVVEQVEEVERLRWAGVPLYALDRHMAVFWVFQSSRKAPGGLLSQPMPDDESIGLHAVSVEGFDSATNSIRFRNNWGSGWGDRGYGNVTIDYLEKFHHETFVQRMARWGPSPYKRTRMLAAQGDRNEIRRLWSVQNPREVLIARGRGFNLRIHYYETVSPTTNADVTCFAVTTGFGLRIGWCFLRHLETGLAEIAELFVWPTFRRMGIGSWLEAEAVEAAAYRGSSVIQLIMNEADAVIGPPRAAARKFAAARGYSLRWRLGVNPRSHATGIKAI